MNIFVTDQSPVLCAQMLDDKRLVKMVLETAQLLCSAAESYGIQMPYKVTHKNHPCTLWVGENSCNYLWTYLLFINLNKEYCYRYDKLVHKSFEKCDGDVRHAYGILEAILPKTPVTSEFANCTPFKYVDDIYLAYRLCMANKWSKSEPVFTKRGKPSWYEEAMYLLKDYPPQLEKLK